MLGRGGHDGTEVAGRLAVDEVAEAVRRVRLDQGDVALIKAYAADRFGNLVYRKTARNFGPVMAAAAEHTIVQVDEIREEPIDPEHVITPGIYTDTVVRIATASGEKERAEREALAAGRPKPCAATTTTAEQAAEGK